MKDRLCCVIGDIVVCCYPWEMPKASSDQWKPFQHTCEYFFPKCEDDGSWTQLNTCSHSSTNWHCRNPLAVEDAQLDHKLEEL